MSGYDALDELHERLRGTEDARRAGGITPEAIRAARGGAVDESWRIPATVAENAADGDSAPLAGIPRDTRERIEADAWELARLDMSRTWEERRDAIVALLDRQARLTERDCAGCAEFLGVYADSLCDPLKERIVELRKKVNALAVERDELRARLDALAPRRSVEDVLFEFWHEFGREVEWKQLEGRVSEYAAEIRELMEVE